MIRVKQVEISFVSPWKALGLMLLVGAAFVWATFHLSARVRGAQLANMVAEVQSLESALAYDPDQPEVHTRLGFYHLYDPLLFDPVKAIRHFQAAVQQQPFEPSAWVNLGRAYEQQGDFIHAEQAYKIGVDLAPNHFNPRWMYGNFLLRRGDLEQAFIELRRVADVYPESVGNICELVWQTTGGKAGVLVDFGASLRSGSAKWEICRCLVGRSEYRRVVDLWKMISDNDLLRASTGHSLVTLLGEARQWSLSQLVWQDVMAKEHGEISPADQTFWNGDFEYDPAGGRFDWRIFSSDDVEARFDPLERHQGKQSLLLDFKQHQRVVFEGVTHDLWVHPSTSFRLRFSYKTEGMPQATGLSVEISDAEMPGRFRVQSSPIGNETQWTAGEIAFETLAETQVLRLRIVRMPVGKIYDYVEGRVWFDSFALEPMNSGEDSGNNSEPGR